MSYAASQTAYTEPKSKWKAILLAFFLGSFGLHKFYLGNRKLGIEYLCLFWSGIPGIYGMFNAFYMLFMSQKSFDKKYNMIYCVDCDDPIAPFSTRKYCDECEPQSHNHNKEDDGKDEIRTRKEKSEKKNKEDKESIDSILNELNGLVGLQSVKEEITTLINFIKIQKERKESGLKTSALSYHMVFTGNPGTGKTTVARIVSKIYEHLGILEMGDLIETDRAGLVAEYEGQTAVRVNEVVDSALDSVLFIDEAYSLNSGDKEIFGKEAVATLLKRIEDDRERLVVILAGYTKEMKDFMNTNPGLQSRFNRYIEFPDYTPEDLAAIFEINCQKNDYILEETAKAKALKIFTEAYEKRENSFGNGRFVRNVFENTIERHSNRIASQNNIDKQMLTTILTEDVSLN